MQKRNEIEEEFERSERRIRKIAEEEIKKIEERIKSVEKEAEIVGKEAENSLREEKSIDEEADSS